ncbi:hypothetical protein [Elizabethkingia anophelis]|uniref:hypothetical protein n=1 Tax=Elizabethkingia anophelis TaxID=1117645 RepID=UPI001370BD41|nr:hypothetical protein [Elizabethkingia anophelis]MYY43952.1 hypothetical protein [Elizabethkingia anophelis]
MKNLRITMSAIAIAAGAVVAFAFSPNKAESKVLTTFHAIEDSPGSNNYHWSSTIPSGFSCKSGLAVCDLEAQSQPTDNQLPNGVQSQSQVYRAQE